VETTFEKILKDGKYHPDRKLVEQVLKEMNYSINESPFGIKRLDHIKMGDTILK